MNYIKKFFSLLGPGLVTGVADDDPSGIATYSQTGAQFGYGQLWAALFMFPMMVAIQEACARIGAVKGVGIAAIIKKNYSKSILYPVILLLLIANIINIGADIGAMAAAANLIVPVDFTVLAFTFTAIILLLQVFVSYKKYAAILKWLCVFLLAYPLTLFIIDAPWLTIIKATFTPHIEFTGQYLFIIVGVFGTTISPYLFFWQASQVVEEERANKMTTRGYLDSRITKKYMFNLRLDNFSGMLFSEICSWSIIVVAATVLSTHGIKDIKTAADAAKALEPFVHGFPHAGYIAKFIFAVGIIGVGLIAVPVLAGSAAYAVSETFNLRKGLNLKLKDGHSFYGVIIAATLIGLAFNFIGIDPMKALIYAAVINGVVAVPLILLIALIANNEKIMGTYKSGWLSNTFLIMTFIGMLVTSLAMFATLG